MSACSMLSCIAALLAVKDEKQERNGERRLTLYCYECISSSMAACVLRLCGCLVSPASCIVVETSTAGKCITACAVAW